MGKVTQNNLTFKESSYIFVLFLIFPKHACAILYRNSQYTHIGFLCLKQALSSALNSSKVYLNRHILLCCMSLTQFTANTDLGSFVVC